MKRSSVLPRVARESVVLELHAGVGVPVVPGYIGRSSETRGEPDIPDALAKGSWTPGSATSYDHDHHHCRGVVRVLGHRGGASSCRDGCRRSRPIDGPRWCSVRHD
jgi:hypothetical protein